MTGYPDNDPEFESSAVQSDETSVQIQLALNRRIHQQEMLALLSQRALRGVHLQFFLEMTIAMIGQTTNVKTCRIWECLNSPESIHSEPGQNQGEGNRPEGLLLALRATTEGLDSRRDKTAIEAKTQPLAAYALSNREPVCMTDVATETRFDPSADYDAHGLRSAVAVLIHNGHGVYGVLEAASENPHAFMEYDVTFLQAVANLVGIVIEQSRLKQEVEETTNRYEMVLDAVSQAVWDWNLETDKVYWNDQLFDLLGLSRAEFTPSWDSVAPLIHPEDRPRVESAIWRQMRTGGSCELEYRILNAISGEYIYLYTQLTVILDQDGNAIHMAGLSSDITARKRSELLLKESEERFRAIGDDAPFMIWMTHADGMPFYMNRAWWEFTGLDESLGLASVDLSRLVHADDLPDVMERYLSAFEKRASYQAEYRLRRCDGQFRWIYAMGNPRFSADGRFIGYLGCYLDITDRKRMEQALQESEERFRNMADAAPALIGFVDANGKAVYYNRYCEQFANAPMRDLLDDGWMRAVHPEDRERLVETYRQHIASQERFTFEYRAVRHDGKICHLFNTAAPRFNSEGEFLGYVLIGVDITGQKEAMTRFERLMSSNIMGVCNWRQDGVLLDANDAFLNTIGYTRSELEAGQINWRALTPPEFEAQEEKCFRELNERGACTPCEKQYIHKDGHRVDIILGAAYLQDSVEEGMAFMLDISPRKQAERALLQSLEREQLRRRIAELASQAFDMANILDAVSEEVGRFFKVDRCLVTGYEPMREESEPLRLVLMGQYCTPALPLREVRKDVLPGYLAQGGITLNEAIVRLNAPDMVGMLRQLEAQPAVEVCDDIVGLADASVDIGSNSFLRAWISLMVEEYRAVSCLRVGIQYRGTGYGSISLFQCEFQRVWTQEEMELLDDIAFHVGSVLYQAKLYEQEQTAKRQLQWNLDRESLRRRILEVGGTSTDLERISQTLAEQVGRYFQADRCFLMRYDASDPATFRASLRTVGQYCSSDRIKPLLVEEWPEQMFEPLSLDFSQGRQVEMVQMPNRQAFEAYIRNRMANEPLPETQKQEFCEHLTRLLFEDYGAQSILRLDIIYQGNQYGILALHFCEQPRQWRQEESDILYDIAYYIGGIFYQQNLYQQEAQAKQELEKSYRLLRMVSEAQAHYISSEEPGILFEDLVNKLLAYTESEFGFIGEAMQDDQRQPYLKFRYLTNIAWDEETRRLYETQWETGGMEFHSLKTLFGHVLTTGQPLIANDPLHDSHRGGLPEGHPPLKAFMGLPIYKGAYMVGMVGIANRPGGYPDTMPEELQPYLMTCANIIWGTRTENLREKLTQDLRESERSLKDYTLRLEKSNQELEQFATIASHDLQAPLRKVVLFSEFLKSAAGDKLPQDCLEYVDRIQKAVFRMQALISDLLRLSRVTRKGKPFKPVDLGLVIREVLLDLDENRRDVCGAVEVGNSLIIDADETQMHQVFQNLIGNGLKFHKKNVPPVVRVDMQALKGGVCRITVQDNGIGFDEKYLDRVFAVFERLHGEQEYEGTGMGLAIVQKIIERHHGSITAKSAPGKGTTFIVHLPVHQGGLKL